MKINSKFLDRNNTQIRLSHIQNVDEKPYDAFVNMCLTNTLCMIPTLVVVAGCPKRMNIWAKTFGFDKNTHEISERYTEACQRLAGVKVSIYQESGHNYYYFSEIFIPDRSGINTIESQKLDSFRHELFKHAEELDIEDGAVYAIYEAALRDSLFSSRRRG